MYHSKKEREKIEKVPHTKTTHFKKFLKTSNYKYNDHLPLESTNVIIDELFRCKSDQQFLEVLSESNTFEGSYNLCQDIFLDYKKYMASNDIVNFSDKEYCKLIYKTRINEIIYTD